MENVEVDYFYGEYTHNLDAKGRLTIPSKIREIIGDQCVVAPGYDQCLRLFPRETWEADIDFIKKGDPKDKKIRMLRRKIISKSDHVEFDKQGRIPIKQTLREAIDLEKAVLIIGVGDHLELWNPEVYEEIDDDEDFDLADLVQSVYESEKEKGNV